MTNLVLTQAKETEETLGILLPLPGGDFQLGPGLESEGKEQGMWMQCRVRGAGLSDRVLDPSFSTAWKQALPATKCRPGGAVASRSRELTGSHALRSDSESAVPSSGASWVGFWLQCSVSTLHFPDLGRLQRPYLMAGFYIFSWLMCKESSLILHP